MSEQLTYTIRGSGENFNMTHPQKLSLMHQSQVVAWCDGRSLFLDWDGLAKMAKGAKGGGPYEHMGPFIAAMLVAAKSGVSGESQLPDGE